LNNLATLPVKRIQALLISACATMYRSDTRFTSEGTKVHAAAAAADFALGSNRRSNYIFILFSVQLFSQSRN